MHIRPFQSDQDTAGLGACLVELQNYERDIDPRLPTGESIVDAYVAEMQVKSKRCHGEILIAELDGEVAGYVHVLTKVSSGNLDDGNIEHGLIADLCVKQTSRGKGMGKKLLAAAEQYAMESGVRWLRLEVLTSNPVARSLYEESGYSALYLEMEKELDHL